MDFGKFLSWFQAGSKLVLSWFQAGSLAGERFALRDPHSLFSILDSLFSVGLRANAPTYGLL